jgi:hypothetical protein
LVIEWFLFDTTKIGQKCSPCKKTFQPLFFFGRYCQLQAFFSEAFSPLYLPARGSGECKIPSSPDGIMLSIANNANSPGGNGTKRKEWERQTEWRSRGNAICTHLGKKSIQSLIRHFDST